MTTEDYHSEFIEGIPVIRHNPELLMKLVSPEFTQFILAIDEENKAKQDFWLRYLIRKGCPFYFSNFLIFEVFHFMARICLFYLARKWCFLE